MARMTFDEICDKYDVVVAGNVGPLTLEQKKTVIKEFVTLEKTKISESLDDDFKIAYKYFLSSSIFSCSNFKNFLAYFKSLPGTISL